FCNASQAQAPAPPGTVPTNNVYPIDLLAALRLADAQNLDIRIARERLKEAKAYYASAVEQFLPWISPGAAYRRHENRIQVGLGIAFRGDELRVQVQTERYQLALRQALEQQRVAAARLAQILHLDSSVELVPQDADLVPLTLVETNASLDALVQQAVRSRPE